MPISDTQFGSIYKALSGGNAAPASSYGLDSNGAPTTSSTVTSPSVSGGKAYSNSNSPTVVTDSNTRESTIPDVNNKSNNLLGTNNTPQNTTNDSSGKSNDSSSYEDVYNKAFGDVSSKVDSDPTTNYILQSIRDMQAKSDASTAAQLDAVSAGFADRANIEKESNESTTGILKGLLQTSGAYKTGSGPMLINEKEKYDVQGLSVLASQELAAKATIYKAKQDSDFQLMDKANTVLENLQTKKQTLATNIANAVIQKNKDDRAYNLSVEQFNHTVSNDAKTQERETEKVKQGRYEYRDLKDEFGNTIGTQVYDKESNTPDKPISVISTPGSGKPGVNGVLNPVQLNSDGTPNKNDQEKALTAIPASMRQIVSDIADYKQNPAGLSKKGNSAAVLKSYASTINPNYHEDYYPEIQKTRADYTSGKTSQNIKSLNTSINHTGDLAKDFTNLPNTDITKYNSIQNWFKSNGGSGDPTKVINDLNALGGELAKTYKGTAGTDSEIANIEKGINVNSSPAQFKAFIESSMNLLGGRLNALEEGYVDPGGTRLPDSHSLLQPTTLKILTGLKDSGWDIQVPGVLYTNKDAFIKSVPDYHDRLTNSFNALKEKGLPTTPENVLQYAQLIY